MARIEVLPTSPAATSPARSYVVRFDLHQRIQHVLMFSSFIVLALTGLSQKFADLAISQQFIAALGGLEATQVVHHVAAFVMIFDGAYHLAYLFYSVGVRRQFQALQMVPSLKDFRDMFQMMAYFVGVSRTKPKFGRFSYLEKFDYWAVFWGMMVIGGSGLVLMFPVFVSRIVGGPVIPVALAAHSDEAVLAVGWIFVVHLFYAHLHPAVFPFNKAIFTGKVPLERYREEHPLEVLDESASAVAEAARLVREAATQAETASGDVYTAPQAGAGETGGE